MASEDSRYRDRCLRFMSSVSRAMSRSPVSVRCTPASMLRRTDANGTKSECLAVLSGCSSKNGMTTSKRSRRLHGERRAIRDGRHDGGSRSPNHSRTPRGGDQRRSRIGSPRTRAGPASRVDNPGPNHRDRETAFTVDEADDPLLDTWPFLLSVRPYGIVDRTEPRALSHDCSDTRGRSPTGYSAASIELRQPRSTSASPRSKPTIHCSTYLAFPADCPHRMDCDCPRLTLSRGCDAWTSTTGYSGFPAFSQLHSIVTALRGNSLAREGLSP